MVTMYHDIERVKAPLLSPFAMVIYQTSMAKIIQKAYLIRKNTGPTIQKW